MRRKIRPGDIIELADKNHYAVRFVNASRAQIKSLTRERVTGKDNLHETEFSFLAAPKVMDVSPGTEALIVGYDASAIVEELTETRGGFIWRI